MERTMWSDERLDDRFDSLDGTLKRVDTDLRELRAEVRDMRQLMFLLWGPTMLGIFGMIATVIVTNG
jgi:glutamine synthetase adenylyltransferase